MSRDDIRGPKWDVETGIPDLTGKVAIVTGANSSVGIGFNIAHHLALNGARVYLGARSVSKANDAIAEMRKMSPGKNLDLKPIVMDLGDFKQTKACGNSFAKSEVRLDILVHNAGLLARPLDKDANGISVSMATNHFGPFILTQELLPLLQKTAAVSPGVRVVTLSSTTHAIVPPGIKFSSLEDINNDLGGTNDFNSNYQRYGLSKLANVLFAKELQRRFDRNSINAISLSLHPGGVKTTGAINFLGDANSPLFEGALTPLEGSLTALFAATKEEVWTEKEKYKGSYLMPFGVVEEASENARNEELAKQLWETTETIVQGTLTK